MKYLVSLIIYTTFWAANAAIPSVEGLFRGAGNNDIAAEGVQFSYIAELELEENEVLPEGKIEKVYVKVTTSKEKNRDINLIQEVFLYENNKRGKRISLKYISRVGKYLKSVPEEEKRIFLSLLLSLARNESVYISDFLKETDPEYIDNKQAMDKEKVAILADYKKKLVVKKEMKDLEIEEEQMKKYRETLSKSLFVNKNAVSLIRRNKQFLWDVNLSNFNAKFDVNSHKLEEVVYSQDEKTVMLNFNDYILFNGLHTLPKTINLKVNESRGLEVHVNQLRHFKNYNRKDLYKRYSELKKKQEENREVEFAVVF